MLKYSFHNIKKINMYFGNICFPVLIQYVNNEAVNKFKMYAN